jgi:hypothetical protein
MEGLEDRHLLATGLVSCVSDSLRVGETGIGDSASTCFSISADGRYAAFSSAAADLVTGDTNGWSDVFAKDLRSGVTTLVSTDASGVQANGDSSQPAISRDGRYVAFGSVANNLVDGDTNQWEDIFLKDRASGAVTLVSTDSQGAQSNWSSYSPALSDDGRYVVFYSLADNLVDGDTNNSFDVFVKDLTSGVTTLVSCDSNGVLGNGDASGPAITGDGRQVAFKSTSTNLVVGDTNSVADIFVKDLEHDTITLVSTATDGVLGNGGSDRPTLSRDGRYVAFESGATNLVDDDINSYDDAFRKDLVSGVTTRVSTDSDGYDSGRYSGEPRISDDGRYVVFTSISDYLVAGDYNDTYDVFVKDTVSGVTTLASANASGEAGDALSVVGAISGDGRYVTFLSESTNFVAGDIHDFDDVFAKDLLTGAIRCVSDRCDDIPGPYSIWGFSNVGRFSVSDDGRYVAFASYADNLVDGDTNYEQDIFVQDLVSGAVRRVSTDSNGVQGNSVSYEGPAISGDGRYVAFASRATNLVSDDTNGWDDVFVKDLVSGITVRVNTSAGGAQCNGGWAPVLSDDGRYVAFASYAADLVADDTNGDTDIFVKDLVSGGVTRVSTNSGGVEGDESSDDPAISDDGRYVTFTSNATNLVDIDTNRSQDVFVKDLLSGVTRLVSSNSEGVQGSSVSWFPSISGDGRYVAFSSLSTNLAGDCRYFANGFVKDLVSGAITRVNTDSPDPMEDGGNVFRTAISDDGRYVVFDSDSANLVAGDTNDAYDIFVRDLLSGTLACVSTDVQGTLGNDASEIPALSGNGRRITFTSKARNLTDGDRNSCDDAFFAANPLVPNQAPTAIALNPASVAEGCTAGTLVGTLTTTDPDAGEMFTYTLVTNAGGRFTIVGDRVLVADGARLDYEAATSHTISVQTTDVGGLSFQQELTITLTDVRDFDSVAVFNPATSWFYLRGENTSGAADYVFGYGAPEAGWKTLVGDWDGDGGSGVGLYDPQTSTFYLTSSFQTGVAEYTFGYGVPGAGWIPLTGDWDGNGTTGVGLYDPHSSTFYLTNALATGVAEHTFGYGAPDAGWQPLVGDWNGDRADGVGLYDPAGSMFYLTSAFVDGFAQYMFGYGAPGAGWQPLVGDWNGNGASGVGLYDPHASTFYLTDTLVTGCAAFTFGYGPPDGGWVPLVADWNGDGAAGVGLYDPAGTMFYLTNALSTGTAEAMVQISEACAGCVPLVGCWTRLDQPLSATGMEPVDLAERAVDSVLAAWDA